ncbi:MAG: hypothetical protein VB051_03165 [Candidatus Pelethousia sp.]|nr:hypothetical protein [Candidatus Pelethousia sp.]
MHGVFHDPSIFVRPAGAVAPDSVNPSSYGAPLFVLFSGILGMCRGIVAYRTKSIRWTLLSHIVVDFSGFGAMFYLSNMD